MAEAEEQDEYHIDFLTEDAIDVTDPGITGSGTTNVEAAANIALETNFDVERAVVEVERSAILDPQGVDDFDFRIDEAVTGDGQDTQIATLDNVDEQGIDFEIDYDEEEREAPSVGEPKSLVDTFLETPAFPGTDEETQIPKDEGEIGYENDDYDDSMAHDSAGTDRGSEQQEADLEEESEQQDSAGQEEIHAALEGEPETGLPVADANPDLTGHETPATALVDQAEDDTSLDGLDDSQSPIESLDVAVNWNGEQYSLLGQQDDDPDSFFLSDVSEIDNTISKLLARLREVVASEISPKQELFVRVPQLNLEFGENSDDNFLNRSFREILTCFRKLALNEGDSPMTMFLDLDVRHDCEDRFLELLEAADHGKGLTDVVDYASPDQYESSPEKSELDRADDDMTTEEYPQEYSFEDGGSLDEALVEVHAEAMAVAVTQGENDITEGVDDEAVDETEGDGYYPGIDSPFGENQTARQDVDFDSLEDIQDEFLAQSGSGEVVAGDERQDDKIDFGLPQAQFDQEAEGISETFGEVELDLQQSLDDGTEFELDAGDNQEEDGEENINLTDGNDPRFSSLDSHDQAPKEEGPKARDERRNHPEDVDVVDADSADAEIDKWLLGLPDEDQDQAQQPSEATMKRPISPSAEVPDTKRAKFDLEYQQVHKLEAIDGAQSPLVISSTLDNLSTFVCQDPGLSTDSTGPYVDDRDLVDYSADDNPRILCNGEEDLLDYATNEGFTMDPHPSAEALSGPADQHRMLEPNSDPLHTSSKSWSTSVSRRKIQKFLSSHSGTSLDHSCHQIYASIPLTSATEANNLDHEDPQHLNTEDSAGTNSGPHFDDNTRADNVPSDDADESESLAQPTGVEQNPESANDKVNPNGTAHATAPTALSNGTSATSTLNGEEIETTHLNDALVNNGVDDQSGGGRQPKDEIDWESGDDDETKQPVSAGPTSNISAKRSREFDNEASLDDESDNKRRRT